ncbi:MAG: hypothetical protein LBC81_05400 [Tannerellaceae bacterium]|nr:hypothetical protein [Tannerellaceae bacterium]
MPGVLKMDTKSMNMVIDAPYFAPYGFYAEGLNASGFAPDDCILFSFSLDLADPANADINSKGYYTGTVGEISRVDEGQFLGSMLDTAALLNAEQKIAYAVDANFGSNGGYAFIIANKLFLFSDITMMSKQENKWILHCDYANLEPQQDSSTGLNAYSFFLRSTIDREGQTPEQNNVSVNAFPMKSALDRIQELEKQGTNSEAILRIHFIKDIKDNGQTLVWDKSDLRIFIARE